MTIAFSRVRFILTEPSHPGNIGSSARAIKNMGFAHLWLVAPKSPDMAQDEQAIALASGATDILQNAQQTQSLEQALAPITLAFALTARPRDLGPPPCDIREAATLAREHLHADNTHQVAIVLGSERAGLTNEQIAHCHRICHIPANPDYSSLNVAQALQLAAWELRYALIAADERLPHTPDLAPDLGKRSAQAASVQALLAHWQQALTAVSFLDPANPKKLMPRMQHLLQKSDLTQDEVDMLRGVCTAMIQAATRNHDRKHDSNHNRDHNRDPKA
jgi:tRNA/rRNA methyltransferase